MKPKEKKAVLELLEEYAACLQHELDTSDANALRLLADVLDCLTAVEVGRRLTKEESQTVLEAYELDIPQDEAGRAAVAKFLGIKEDEKRHRKNSGVSTTRLEA